MSVLSAPTLTVLLASTRTLLNQTSSTNSFWTDAELTSYLNEAVRRYFTEIVQYAEGQFTTTTDLNIANNTETVALPSDCFKVLRLWKKLTNGYEILFYRNKFDEGYSTQGGTSSELYIPCYYFRGVSLVLRPTPNFAETAGLKLEYIQFPDELATGADTLSTSVAAVFKDLIVMYAVWKAKLKESLVNGSNTYVPAADNLKDLYQTFKESITPRADSPTAIKPWTPEFDF